MNSPFEAIHGAPGSEAELLLSLPAANDGDGTGPLAPPTSVNDVRPSQALRLYAWSAFEVPRDGLHQPWTRHFAGVAREEGRVSCAITSFDPMTRCGVARDGRVYELAGRPGLTNNGSYAWSGWKRVAGISEERDVTEEVWSELTAPGGDPGRSAAGAPPPAHPRKYAPYPDRLSEVILQSTLTCPECSHAKEETMPTDACQWFYECENCRALLRPLPGDCCVFCSYGSVKCPPVQSAPDSCCMD